MPDIRSDQSLAGDEHTRSEMDAPEYPYQPKLICHDRPKEPFIHSQFRPKRVIGDKSPEIRLKAVPFHVHSLNGMAEATGTLSVAASASN